MVKEVTHECNPKECYDLLYNADSLHNVTKGCIFRPFYMKNHEDFEDTFTYEYLRQNMSKITRYYGTLKVIVKPSDPSYLVATLVQYCANNYIDLVLFHSMGKHNQSYMTQYFKNVN